MKDLRHRRAKPHKKSQETIPSVLRAIHALRKKYLLLLAEKPVPAGAKLSKWHYQDSPIDEMTAVLPFYKPSGATGSCFRKFLHQRALLKGIKQPEYLYSLGGKETSRVQQYKFLRRPFSVLWTREGLIDLSVILDVDLEMLLDVALRNEREFLVMEMQTVVARGTLLTGPVLVRDEKLSQEKTLLEPPLILPAGVQGSKRRK